MSASIPTPVAPSKYPVTDSVRAALERSRRRASELLPEDEWLTKLARSEATGIPLRIKLGLDPTAPDIHLGHTIVLNKLRELQDLGHTVIFLIGDFTSMIGDPSGRNTTRPPLTREQIEVNARTYFAQASLVLDPERTEVRYTPNGATRRTRHDRLAARYAVARMMERDDFSKRLRPERRSASMSFSSLMQGYDSVALRPTSSSAAPTRSSTRLSAAPCRPIRPGAAVHHDDAPARRARRRREMSKSKGNYIAISEPPRTCSPS
jgi:tyrosyl-tRNA synthetase